MRAVYGIIYMSRGKENNLPMAENRGKEGTMQRYTTMDKLYAAADFLYANSTEAERIAILNETARGRAKDKGLSNNDRKSYFDRRTNKRLFKKILKSF